MLLLWEISYDWHRRRFVCAHPDPTAIKLRTGPSPVWASPPLREHSPLSWGTAPEAGTRKGCPYEIAQL